MSARHLTTAADAATAPAPAPAAMRFRCEHRSHPGMVRAQNEDALLAQPGRGLWAVADGMAGHHRGDEAAHALVSALSTCLAHVPRDAMPSRSVAVVEETVARVHSRLLTEARRSRADVIGSTLAVVLSRGPTTVVLWAGDSRVYHQRGPKLTCLTRDHAVEGGALSRAVGAGNTCWLDTAAAHLRPRDRLLLCSDGLTKELSDAELAAHLEGAPGLARCADALLETALGRNARDNVSFILVEAL